MVEQNTISNAMKLEKNCLGDIDLRSIFIIVFLFLRIKSYLSLSAKHINRREL
jgi:hypothetical protein